LRRRTKLALWTATFVVRQSDWPIGTGPLPSYPQHNRNRGEGTEAKECPSRTPPLILIELFGKQQSNTNAESHTGASDKGDFRNR
jgi:hypothetical protein